MLDVPADNNKAMSKYEKSPSLKKKKKKKIILNIRKFS